MSKLRKILFAIAAFGGAATAIGAGTFASFSASTTNGSNTFATGTLVLSNQKNTATACLSTGAGTTTDSNANGACDSLFSTTLAKPGDSGFVDVTLKNEGSINGATLTAYKNAACTNANSGTYNGTGDLCANLQVYVQEYTSAANRTANTTTGGTCVYGGGTASACAFDATKTLGAFPASGTPLTLSGGLNAGASRYLRVYVQFPTTADNTYQGRQASFGFTWAMAQ
jgi:predicted ribosomally synthesized peptide with SipW-like signal peptide